MDDLDQRAKRIEEIELFHLMNTLSRAPSPPLERPTIHYSKLGELDPRSRKFVEWSFYRREVARLLAEGYEGKWVVIRGERILDCYETWEDARRYAQGRPDFQEVLVKQVLTFEPVYRVGYNRLRWPD